MFIAKITGEKCMQHIIYPIPHQPVFHITIEIMKIINKSLLQENNQQNHRYELTESTSTWYKKIYTKILQFIQKNNKKQEDTITNQTVVNKSDFNYIYKNKFQILMTYGLIQQ